MDELYYRKRGFGNHYLYRGPVLAAKISITFGQLAKKGQYSIRLLSLQTNVYAKTLGAAKEIAEAHAEDPTND